MTTALAAVPFQLKFYTRLVWLNSEGFASVYVRMGVCACVRVCVRLSCGYDCRRFKYTGRRLVMSYTHCRSFNRDNPVVSVLWPDCCFTG